MTDCPYCGEPVFTMAKDGDRLKARTSILVLHKSGEVEINCPHCKQGLIVPLAAISGDKQLRKARVRQVHLLKKDLDTTG